MHVEFLVEDPSAEAALKHLLPRLLRPDVSFRILNFGGKQRLLKELPNRLRGYAAWIPDDFRIVVLVDEDREDCHALKARLEAVAAQAGLTTKSSTGAGVAFQVLNRLAIEELEAWFFGDVEALRQAYPRLPATLANRSAYRDPDAIPGGTWEALERELQRVGYFRGGLPKKQAAAEIAAHMDVHRNRSHSFQTFRDGLLGVIG